MFVFKGVWQISMISTNAPAGPLMARPGRIYWISELINGIGKCFFARAKKTERAKHLASGRPGADLLRMEIN